jgi:hypothetical protein
MRIRLRQRTCSGAHEGVRAVRDTLRRSTHSGDASITTERSYPRVRGLRVELAN